VAFLWDPWQAETEAVYDCATMTTGVHHLLAERALAIRAEPVARHREQGADPAIYGPCDAA
jgi:hypothetical protein